MSTPHTEIYAICVYEADRTYGGPEEGGWYYRSGTLIRSIAVANGWHEAVKKTRRANTLFDYLARNKLPLEHPYYNGGIYFSSCQMIKCGDKEIEIPKHVPLFKPEYKSKQ